MMASVPLGTRARRGSGLVALTSLDRGRLTLQRSEVARCYARMSSPHAFRGPDLPNCTWRTGNKQHATAIGLTPIKFRGWHLALQNSCPYKSARLLRPKLRSLTTPTS